MFIEAGVELGLQKDIDYTINQEYGGTSRSQITTINGRRVSIINVNIILYYTFNMGIIFFIFSLLFILFYGTYLNNAIGILIGSSVFSLIEIPYG